MVVLLFSVAAMDTRAVVLQYMSIIILVCSCYELFSDLFDLFSY